MLSLTKQCIPIEEPEIDDPTAQTLAMAGAALASSTAIINLSSPSGLWIVFNQYQLLLLLLLTGAYFPIKVVKLLTGMGLALFSFSFLDPLYENSFNYLRTWNYSPQKDPYLEEMGINSENSFYNLFTLMLVFLFIIVIHVIYSFLF